jgi:hypothetical protein
VKTGAEPAERQDAAHVWMLRSPDRSSAKRYGPSRTARARRLIAITGGTGSGEGSGSGGTGGAAVPWWRRPAILAGAGAIAVAVLSGWIQQGGATVASLLFGDEEIAEPVVHAKTMEPDFCGVWHLNKSASVVSGELKKKLNGRTSFESGEADYRKTLFDVRKATGSDLPSGNTVEVTIEGSNDKAVILNSLDIVVRKRSALSGDLMLVGSGCGGGIAARRYVVDLDKSNPHFEVVEESSPGEKVTKPVDFPYRVSSGDPEVFILEGATKGEIIEWKATLNWTSGGKEGSTEISDGGKPFVSFPEAPAGYSFNTDVNKLENLP